MEFNALDYLLVVLLLVGTFWGLMQGVIRLLTDLLGLYIGLVVTLLLYRPLAGFFQDLVPAMSNQGSQALAFGLLIMIFVNGLGLVSRFTGIPPEERKRKKKLDVEKAAAPGCERYIWGGVSQLGGLVVGFLVSVIWLSMLLAVLQFVLRTGGDSAVRASSGLRFQLQTSLLVPVFNYVVFLIYRSVRFWLPGDQVPAIFSIILNF
jgi:uncharacterized membrane protein required for colicin V production